MSEHEIIDLTSSPLAEKPDFLFPSLSALNSDHPDHEAHSLAKDSAATPSSLNKESIFDFFGLPAEIRRMIYKLIFTNTLKHVVGKRTGGPIAGVHMFSVCKQMYAETFNIVYFEWLDVSPLHTDTTPHIQDVSPVASRISRYTLARFRRLYIRLDVPPGLTSFALPMSFDFISQMTALSTIGVTVSLRNASGRYHWTEASLSSNPFFLGLVVHVLGRTPKHVSIRWFIYIWDGSHTRSMPKVDIIEKYKSIRGVTCMNTGQNI